MFSQVDDASVTVKLYHIHLLSTRFFPPTSKPALLPQLKSTRDAAEIDPNMYNSHDPAALENLSFRSENEN